MGSAYSSFLDGQRVTLADRKAIFHLPFWKKNRSVFYHCDDCLPPLHRVMHLIKAGVQIDCSGYRTIGLNVCQYIPLKPTCCLVQNLPCHYFDVCHRTRSFNLSNLKCEGVCKSEIYCALFSNICRVVPTTPLSRERT